MSEDGSCKRGLKSLLSAKLGRCMRCIRVSALGTTLGWAALAVVQAVWPNSLLAAASLAVAAAFTLLLVVPIS
jgi:hypothetical protein